MGKRTSTSGHPEALEGTARRMLLLEHFPELTRYPFNAEKVMDLVLQLAVQGKLTTKWRDSHPELVEGDNSAAALLEKIRKEKERLVAEKKIKREKHLTEIHENEIITDLPHSWSWIRLGNTCSHITDIDHKMPKSVDDGVKFLSAKDINEDGTINFEHNVKRISEEDYLHYSKRIKPQIGDIIYTRIGSIGRAAIVKTNQKFLVSYSCCTIRPIGIDINYLRYHLSSRTTLEKALADYKGIGVPDLGIGKIKEFLIAFPPLEEQKEIVRIVDQLKEEIDVLNQLSKARIQKKHQFVVSSLQHLTETEEPKHWDLLQNHFLDTLDELENVKKLRETILQLAVQGKLTQKWRTCHPELVEGDHSAAALLEKIKQEKERLIAEKKMKPEKPLPPPTRDEVPYQLPDDWKWVRLQDFGRLERGKSKHRPRNDIQLFAEGKYPLVQTGDVSAAKNTGGKILTNKSYYNDFGLTQSQMWDSGTLCITIAANIAETGFLGFDACFPDSIVGFLDIVDSVQSKYVQLFISVTKSDLEQYAPSTAQKNINLGILNQLIFPTPPLEEQKAIVQKVDQLMALCDMLESQIRTRNETAEQLMKAVVAEVLEQGDEDE